MGDTVVFQDEVDAAMDAAFAAGMEITALHNHFFFDVPKVYFMHIGGHGDPAVLAAGVKSVWDAIKAVRTARPHPALHFKAAPTEAGEIDLKQIGEILDKQPALKGGVLKVSYGREAEMNGLQFGATMGLSTWAAFSGSDARATIDGDFAMTAAEVQPVLRAMRRVGFHVVALHNHMIGETPAYYFTHYWATGPAQKLARSFRQVLAVQAVVGSLYPAGGNSWTWSFDSVAPGGLPRGWKVASTNPRQKQATWRVRAGALALVDTGDSEGSTYNLCWTDEIAVKDITLEVRVKSGPGREDQGGGPIWRAVDADNYYIARWNPLEGNLRAYKVVGGKRPQLATISTNLEGDWHDFTIGMQGAHVDVGIDGKIVLRFEDATFANGGRVGLWTKADAATSFDDFRVTPF